MKLVRLKITDPNGFRSLQAGFEYRFRSTDNLHEDEGFAPFVCAGLNGSGKSNLLEVLAAIFYHLEGIYLANLPESFRYDEESNPEGFHSDKAIPDGFEIEYLFKLPENYSSKGQQGFVHFLIVKEVGQSPKWYQKTQTEPAKFERLEYCSEIYRFLLPDYVLGYSSGENEILSLPFFKMRFVQFDEYWEALKQQLPYSGHPESRFVYLDIGFSQAILLCNLLFNEQSVLALFRREVGIEELREFRIIIRRSIEVSPEIAEQFGKPNDAITKDVDTGQYRVHLIRLLEADEKIQEELRSQPKDSATRYESFDPIVTRLKRCATCWYLDEVNDTLYLDYRVDEATRQAFSENFEFEMNKSPIALFKAFQVLLMLNLFTVSEKLKTELYQSDSLYANETVPVLPSDERIMRFKHYFVKKTDVSKPVLVKSFSDGEHQLLHTMGLCILFKNTQSLFLLDEPETHFNPDWRSEFISRLERCFSGSSENHETLITTHSPFLISDSPPEKVMVFSKIDGRVSVTNPNYNTLGASINKITMRTLSKRETIGGIAESKLMAFRKRLEEGDDKDVVLSEVEEVLGDSIEKLVLVKDILDSMEREA